MLVDRLVLCCSLIPFQQLELWLCLCFLSLTRVKSLHCCAVENITQMPISERLLPPCFTYFWCTTRHSSGNFVEPLFIVCCSYLRCCGIFSQTNTFARTSEAHRNLCI
ncbi:unnamed protein product [Ixodes pacificus]